MSLVIVLAMRILLIYRATALLAFVIVNVFLGDDSIPFFQRQVFIKFGVIDIDITAGMLIFIVIIIRFQVLIQIFEVAFMLVI